MKLFLTSFCIIFLTMWRQSDAQSLLNKHSNQWFGFESEKKSYSQFFLITKKNGYCERQKINISKNNIHQYIDSLEKNGWTHQVTFQAADKKYKPTIELKSVAFSKLNGIDSVFQIIFKINLLNSKTNIAQFQLDTIYRTNKAKIIEGIQSKDYKFSPIEIQKGTGIIRVSLHSASLLDIETHAPVSVFDGSWAAYFF